MQQSQATMPFIAPILPGGEAEPAIGQLAHQRNQPPLLSERNRRPVHPRQLLSHGQFASLASVLEPIALPDLQSE